MNNKKEIINALIKNGAKKIADLKVKNVTITPMDEYTRVSLSVDKDIPAFRDNGTGVFEEGTSNIVFTTPFAIGSIMKDIPEASFAANHIVEHPAALQVILAGASVDIISERVPQGTPYVNPFSTKEEKEETIFDHDVYINYIVDIYFSDFGIKKLDKMADLLLGF